MTTAQASLKATKARPLGYLPKDRPPLPALIAFGLQHVLTMFPATVFVAILTGFDVGVTLFASGLATVVALLGSGMRIPMYYGSSFSYIAAVVAVVGAEWGGIRVAQGGIVVTSIVSVLAGLLIRRMGKAALDKVLPPVITGSVAIVIGISLAYTALDMASANWPVSLFTLLMTILFSVYLRGRGFLSMIPVLLGALAGYALAAAMGIVQFGIIAEASWLRIPAFSTPVFKWSAILAIAPIAIATIPESTAHLYQISLYIDQLADDLGRPRLEIKNMVGLNLILDGIGDAVNGLLGGCAGTNYGENNSLMAITRNYSCPVIICAGVIAMMLGFVGKLAAVVETLPTAVTGGLAVFLFGIIGLQGVALIQSEKVDLFDPQQLAIGAVILIIGIGGSMFPGGNLPIVPPLLDSAFPDGLPAIATSAMVGILLNAIFLIFPPKKKVEA
ncbi:MAG TPA: xanthine permease [Chloroflexi bacterium]|jgi:uracil permease|nr:xanthine permease [Chloroflexota bacterium]